MINIVTKMTILLGSVLLALFYCLFTWHCSEKHFPVLYLNNRYYDNTITRGIQSTETTSHKLVDFLMLCQHGQNEIICAYYKDAVSKADHALCRMMILLPASRNLFNLPKQLKVSTTLITCSKLSLIFQKNL